MLMIPSMSETFAIFIRYEQKECNLSVCTHVENMIWVAPFFVLPASGVSSSVWNWWAHQDSNLGPTGYEPVALAN